MRDDIGLEKPAHLLSNAKSKQWENWTNASPSASGNLHTTLSIVVGPNEISVFDSQILD